MFCNEIVRCTKLCTAVSGDRDNVWLFALSQSLTPERITTYYIYKLLLPIRRVNVTISAMLSAVLKFCVRWPKPNFHVTFLQKTSMFFNAFYADHRGLNPTFLDYFRYTISKINWYSIFIFILQLLIQND